MIYYKGTGDLHLLEKDYEHLSNANEVEYFIESFRNLLGLSYFKEYPELSVFESTMFTSYRHTKEVGTFTTFKYPSFAYDLYSIENKDFYILYVHYQTMLIVPRTLLGFWLYNDYMKYERL